MRWVGRGLTCSALLWIAAGCVTQAVYDQLVDERDQLVVQRRDLEGRVEGLEAANRSFTAERVTLIDESENLRISRNQFQGEVARLTRTGAELAENLESSQSLLAARATEIEKMRHTYDGLISDLEGEVASGQIKVEKLRFGLQMNLSQDILFASGSAKLNAQGTAVLRKVGKRLVELPNAIEVLGHTDNVSIGAGYPSNWELAAARASSVVRLFVDLGVDPANLKVVSRGEFNPMASNDTAEGRARNRRIEIRLTPARSKAGAPNQPASEESEPAESASEPVEPASEESEAQTPDLPDGDRVPAS